MATVTDIFLQPVCRLAFFATLLIFLSAGMNAQAGNSRGSMLKAQPDAPANATAPYLLGPEDQLSIHVADLEDISDNPVRIDPNGYLDLPLVGRVHAAGQPVEELRSLLSRRLAKYIESPDITINVLEYHSQPVSILGSVNSPGLHQLQGPKTLIDMLSMAGGLRQDAGPQLTITRQMKWGRLPLPGARVDSTGQFSSADLSVSSIMNGSAPADNIPVRPEDVISVSKAEVVYVVGQVKRSGGFTLNSHQSISVLRALSLAEGLDVNAAPKRARIMRADNGEPSPTAEVTVDVQKILEGKAPDQPLYANDILFIPNSLAKSTMKQVAQAMLQAATGAAIYRF